jgi:hypothetical protein
LRNGYTFDVVELPLEVEILELPLHRRGEQASGFAPGIAIIPSSQLMKPVSRRGVHDQNYARPGSAGREVIHDRDDRIAGRYVSGLKAARNPLRARSAASPPRTPLGSRPGVSP